jgi:Tol biopolymer transport system component
MDFEADYAYLAKEFANGQVRDLAWTPEGSSITYAARPSDGSQNWRLFSVTEDGASTTEHFPSVQDVDMTSPSWSLGGRLAYIQTEDSEESIFIDGQEFVKEIHGLSHPVWSNDASYLVAGTSTDVTGDFFSSALARFQLDGAEPVALIQETSDDQPVDEFQDPAFSPDHTHLAFAVQNADDETAEIWVMGIDGSEATMLTSGNSDSHPTWGPNGHWIAFQRDREFSSASPEPAGIFVVRPDGSEIVQITFDDGKYPTWTI